MRRNTHCRDLVFSRCTGVAFDSDADKDASYVVTIFFEQGRGHRRVDAAAETYEYFFLLHTIKTPRWLRGLAVSGVGVGIEIHLLFDGAVHKQEYSLLAPISCGANIIVGAIESECASRREVLDLHGAIPCRSQNIVPRLAEFSRHYFAIYKIAAGGGEETEHYAAALARPFNSFSCSSVS